MDERQELRSLKRGLRALALINQMEAISISELARKLALPRTTTERILTTLATEGYVHRIEADKRYRLSLKVYSLAHGFSDENWISNVASPLLHDFTKAFGWPVAVATPTGTRMSVRLTTDPATSLWLTRRRVGSEMPMLESSAGLLYLAFADSAEREQLLGLIEKSGQPLVIDQTQNLGVVFDRIRRDGFVFHEEAGAREDSIGLPVFVQGKMRAVVMMTFITRGLRRADVMTKYLAHLRQLADQVSQQSDDICAEADAATSWPASSRANAPWRAAAAPGASSLAY